MRSVRHLALVFLLIVGLGPVAWSGPQDFELFNRTGVDIYALYVSPSAEEDWGEDLMDGAVLLNGGDLEIVFSPDEDVEHWDLLIEDEDGNALYWREIDLFSAYQIVLEPNGVARIKE